MKLGLGLVFLAMVLSMKCLANDSIRIVLQSQYNAKIKAANVHINNDTTTFLSDDSGEAVIHATANDSIRISGINYVTTVVAVKNIPANRIVTVKKEFSWKDLLTPMFYIINGGLWFLLFVVFAETGLFVGFFLPGDSLLFVAGIYSAEIIGNIFPFVHNEYLHLFFLWILLSGAGILGNTFGYRFGKKVGPTIYHWKDNILFKQKYLRQAHDFYEKHGVVAIIIARFLPIIRTFAPIVAGIVEMDKKKFRYYNILGCLAWVFSMLVAGHFLQKWILSQFHFDLREHLEVIVIGIVLVTTAPIILKLVTGKKK